MSTERSPLLPTHDGRHSQTERQVASAANDAAAQAKQQAFKLAPAMAALKAGKLPSQDQLDKLLKAALDSDVLSPGIGRGGSRTGRLSEEGARVVRAIRKVMEASIHLGEAKNGQFR
jgi:hypothetical protein